MVAGTLPAGTAPVRILAPAGGEVLIAGQLVEVRWAGLPAGVDEMELLLDVADAADLRLRLTPQLVGSTRSHPWRVPNLPGQHARLRLRWGRDGVETEGEPSAPFTILACPNAPFERVCFRFGEWWVAPALSTFDPARSGIGRVLGGLFEHPQPTAAATVSEPDPPEGGSRHDQVPSREAMSGATAAANPETTARTPLTIPLRP